MAAETFKKLAQVQLGATPTVIYTVPAATYSMVKAIFVTNQAAQSTVVQMWQSGSGPGQQILNPTTLQVGEYGTYDGVIAMSPGDTLQGQCSLANDVTVTVEGLEIT